MARVDESPCILFGLGKTDPFFFASCLAKKRGGSFLQHNMCHPMVLWGLFMWKKHLHGWSSFNAFFPPFFLSFYFFLLF